MSGRFEELERQWNEDQARERGRLKEPDAWPLGRPVGSGPVLIADLRRLYAVTMDSRFMDAVDALAESGMVDLDTGEFRREFTPKVSEMKWANRANAVQALVEKGMTKRMAAAEVAVEHHVPGPNFRSAVDKLRKLHPKVLDVRAPY